MQNGKLLLLNTSVLTVGTVVMRSISVVFNVYLTNKIGSAGIGLFQLVTTVYGLSVTFASGGVKLGATRLVTEANYYDKGKIRCVTVSCIKYALATGTMAAVVLFLFSGIISDKWIADERAAISLKILSLSLPAVAVSSALNGYFTAKKTMTKYAVVQFVEQLMKILITVVSLTLLGNSGTEYACSAVAFGITSSEIFSAVVSCIIFYYENREKIKSKFSVLNKLLHISLPEVTGSGCRSVLLTVEHILIPIGFKKSGYSQEKAMSIYGYIHGMALPVILYPSAFISSLSSMLVPELSHIKLGGNSSKLSAVSDVAIKFTMLFSFGIGIFFFVFSDLVSLAVYNENSSSFYIKLLAILVPVMYCDMITDGLLKGLDEQAASMRYNIFDSAICVILVSVLIPKYSVGGYIFVLFLSEIINFSLSFNRLIKNIGITVNLIDNIVKPVLGAILCCGVVHIITASLCSWVENNMVMMVITAIGYIVLYVLSLYLFGSVNKADKVLFKSLIKIRNYA